MGVAPYEQEEPLSTVIHTTVLLVGDPRCQAEGVKVEASCVRRSFNDLAEVESSDFLATLRCDVKLEDSRRAPRWILGLCVGACASTRASSTTGNMAQGSLACYDRRSGYTLQ